MSNQTGEDVAALPSPITAATLSAIAYCPSKASIMASLTNSCPGWSLAWIPDVEVNGNYAFIAYNQTANQYAVAIRGSILGFSWAAFDDWFEQDLNVLIQCDWTFPTQITPDQQKISWGAHDGLADLRALASTATGRRVRMHHFLMETAVATNASILITGHSLGGALSTVFAPWLFYEIKSQKKSIPAMQVATFAAPAVGNAAFAGAYDTTFQNSQRYYNVFDIVPMASASIKAMGKLYPGLEASSIGYAITLQDLIDGLADGVEFSEEHIYNSHYTQTNANSGSFRLNTDGQLFPVTATDPVEQWFEQAGAQHSIANAYLPFLGGKPFTCS
jgi:triacylglycerol lipase